MAAVTLEKVTKIYSDGSRAVTELSLGVENGESMVLVGPSGSGKTTVLRMIAGLEDTSSGDIYIGDRRVNDVAPKDRDIAMVFQNFALYPKMSARENIDFPLWTKKLPYSDRAERVDGAARMLELMERLDDRPKTMSTSERQRVATGRAVVRRPSVFLMDEALSSLDAKLRAEMRSELADVQRELGVTMLYVTNDHVEAMTMGDRVAVIKAGVLQQVARPIDLYAAPANVFVASFIGSPPMNLYEGVITRSDSDFALQLGDQSITIPEHVIAGRESLARRIGKPLVIGVRPEDLEDAAVNPDHPDDQRLRATVDAREALGAETYLHVGIRAPGVKIGRHDPLAQLGDLSVSRCTARCSRHSVARVGESVELTVDTTRLHFFDRTTHRALV